jgi:HK97 family phage portal protein
MLANLFERRAAIGYETLFRLGGDPILTTNAGVLVNANSSLGLTAVWSAISLTADTISTLPCKGYRYDDNNQATLLTPQPTWISKPDPDMTASSFWQAYITSMMLHGHGFARIYRDGDRVVGMAVLNPIKVKMKRLDDATIEYRYDNKVIPSRDIRSTPYFLQPGEVRGTSPIVQLAQNLGLAIALDTFTARFFGSGANPGLVLKTPGKLTTDQVEDLANQVDAKHAGLTASHRPLILQGGLETEKTTNANDQNQLIESRRFAVEDVARIFNTPPHLLGLPGYNSYASVEESNLQWISHQLRPLATKLEATFSDLLPPGQFLRFNFGALERGNLTSRATAYSQLTQAGIISTDDARRLEDLPLINTDASTYPRVPLANIDIKAAGLAEQEKLVAIATKLIQAGFDPAATLAAVGLPPIQHDGGIPVTLQMDQTQ